MTKEKLGKIFPTYTKKEAIYTKSFFKLTREKATT
jgi:hypothetical protein